MPATGLTRTSTTTSRYGTALYWACDIFDLGGKHAGDGCGRSAGEALAMAWIMLWALDAIGKRPIEIDEVRLKFRPAGGSS